MNRRGAYHTLLASLALLGVVAVAVVALDNRPAEQPPETAQAFQAEQAHLETVRRLISAENAGRAANQNEVREAATQADAVSLDAGDLPPAPPGYSYTPAPTQLKLAPYEASPETASPNEAMPGDQLDWLATDAVDVSAILRRAHYMDREWVFGWLRLAEGATMGDLRRAAASLGIDILGASGRLLRAKLPADEAGLAAVAATEAVSGLAVVPPNGKAAPEFVAQVNATAASVPALITLMSSDQDGLWRRELQKLGAEVGRFDADTRTYAANVDGIVLEAVIQADFVLAVEPMYLFQAAHDTAIPAMGADAVRSRANEQGIFRGIGGRAVPIGVMDTGLNTNHPDIAAHRQSICGANFVWSNYADEEADLWLDENGHGTHVTASIAGNGTVVARYAGMAPSVAHIRFAKVLTRAGWGYSDSIFRGMDFLARTTGCGTSAATVKPLIVNMSLSGNSRRFHGRTASERKLDATVWAHRQLYVVAQSNASISGFSDYGAAKNSLSVGAVQDNGELAGFSSWGPTFDGRLAPQVVATGVRVNSAQGQGQPGGYIRLSGTSMASPVAAGVAALLMDNVAEYREQPALMRARLMASAIKPDAWLGGTTSSFPMTNSAGPGLLQAQYGLGKASARTSVLQRDAADGWENHAATATLEDDSYGYRDIIVPAGASRLDLVLAWDEPPADTIGSTVLNDLDLWLDKDGDCSEAACGEYASQSRRDNVEWIIVRSPAPGTYRVRVVPHRVYTAAPRAGLAWTIVRGASAPNLRLEVDDVRPLGGGRHRIALSISTDAYVAAAVQLALNGCRLVDGARCSPGQRIVEMHPVAAEDGSEYSPSTGSGRVLVGEVGAGERQTVEMDVVGINNEQEAARLYFTASAWNAEPATASVGLPAQAAVDGVRQQPPAESTLPANDHFSAAASIEGTTGSIAADLLTATFEPGEPLPRMGGERPASSVWHRWVAPARGAVRFSVSAEAHVDAALGERIASLTQLASNPWGISFFAEEGQTYHVRVSDVPEDSNTKRSRPPTGLTLRWSQGPRPVNDDFAASVPLDGTEGSVSGHNGGATLEPGEQFGNLAATVWYRWTASEDGAMEFRTDAAESKVLLFTGSAVSALRLVSGYPDTSAQVSVKAGTEYHIAVVADDAFAATRSFELNWQSDEREANNDDFAHAIELTGAAGTQHVSAGESVEPHEPVQTEVRSRWWHWTAPANGRFAWRLTDTAYTELKVAVFELAAAEPEANSDPSLADLELLASTGPAVTSTELSFSAVGGRRYWISVGLHSGDWAAFAFSSASATLRWGEVPANDQLSQAAELSGTSGSAAIPSFGTLEPNEPSGALGHSSLWWWFTPPRSAGTASGSRAHRTQHWPFTAPAAGDSPACNASPAATVIGERKTRPWPCCSTPRPRNAT